MDVFNVAFTPAFTLGTNAGPVAGQVTCSTNGLEAHFTPDEALAYGTTFTGTIKAGALSQSGQPVAADYTWTFTTESPTDWEWSDPVVHSTGAPAVEFNYRALSVDLDDNGNSCAVWTQAEGPAYRVYASRSVQDASWESPVALQPGADAVFASTALVRLDGNGQVLVVWEVSGTIWFNWAGLTGSWGPSQQVMPSLGVLASLLYLTVDSDGNALLFYSIHPPTAQSDLVYALRYDAAQGWDPAPTALGMRSAVNPEFAGDRTGFAVVVWKPEGGNPGLSARRYVPGSGWSATETLDAPDVDRPVEPPTVTTDGAGNALAVWLKRLQGGSGQPFEIFTSPYTPTSGWAVGAAGPSAGALENVAHPMGALALDGSMLVTWTEPQDHRCWASYRPASGDWNASEPVDLDSPDRIRSTGRPHFTVDGRGILFGLELIFVSGPDPDFYNVWVNEFHPSTGWSSPSFLRETENGLIHLSIAHEGEGRAAAFWVENRPQVGTLWWSRYR